MLCTAAPVAAIRQPTGPAHYQAGQVKLTDGTTFEVWGDAQGKAFLANVKTGDRFEICFNSQGGHWADLPSNARQGFAVDVNSNVTLAGFGIPGSGAQTFPLPRTKRRTL